MSVPTLIGFVTVDQERQEVWRENPEQPWPEHVHVTTELLRDADPRFCRVGEGVIEFNTADEYAVYRVDEMGEGDWGCSLFDAGLLVGKERTE